tara:strand:+ start:2897 stop:3349 length:453 start_codon:yes stop_codon:yes gene_type:complete
MSSKNIHLVTPIKPTIYNNGSSGSNILTNTTSSVNKVNFENNVNGYIQSLPEEGQKIILNWGKNIKYVEQTTFKVKEKKLCEQINFLKKKIKILNVYRKWFNKSGLQNNPDHYVTKQVEDYDSSSSDSSSDEENITVSGLLKALKNGLKS